MLTALLIRLLYVISLFRHDASRHYYCLYAYYATFAAATPIFRHIIFFADYAYRHYYAARYATLLFSRHYAA